MSRSPGCVRASTSSVGRHGFDKSTGWQWYTTPSNTDNATIRIRMIMCALPWSPT